MKNRTIKPLSARMDWKYIRSVALGHRKALLAGQAVAVLAAITAVPVPLLMPMLVDEVLLNKPGMAVHNLQKVFPLEWHQPGFYIAALMLLTLMLRFLSAAFNVEQTRQFSLISKDIIFRIRCQLIERLGRISMAEYESMGSGSVITHMISDLDTLDSFIGTMVARCLVAVLTLTGTAVVLLWMNWHLALFILFFNPIVILFTKALGSRVKTLKKNEIGSIGAFQSALTETLEAIHQIRSSNREIHYLARLVSAAKQVRFDSATFAWKSDSAARMSFLVFLTGFDLFRALALLMVVYSDLTIGEMMAVSGYLWFMMAPVQEVLGIQYGFYGAKAAVERINQFCQAEDEPIYPHLTDPFNGKETVGILIDDLHFSYPRGNEVLRGITLNIASGEKVALVGASGGGKSTLIQALIGLYPATKGHVFYDGIPMSDIGADVVREHVATVPQQPILFNDTIRSNLTMGRDADDEVLWRALEVAQLKKIIEDIPDRLDAQVGRNGIRLSGGQRQRLAIARMVLANPKVVVLDEATSAVDNITETRLYKALDEYLAGKTTLIIAHRLSAITHADRILVFEGGRIVEEGDHDSLMIQGGLYSRLYGTVRPQRRQLDKTVSV